MMHTLSYSSLTLSNYRLEVRIILKQTSKLMVLVSFVMNATFYIIQCCLWFQMIAPHLSLKLPLTAKHYTCKWMLLYKHDRFWKETFFLFFFFFFFCNLRSLPLMKGHHHFYLPGQIADLKIWTAKR